MSAPDHVTAMPVDERIGSYIKRAEQVLIARKTQALRQVDLTVAQYTALLTLAERPGLSGADLARSSYVTPQTMTQIIATLEHKGLITRRTSEAHARVRHIALTPAGAALLRRADSLAVDIERELTASFSEEEAAALVDLLDRATTHLATPSDAPADGTWHGHGSAVSSVGRIGPRAERRPRP